jgi:hypothetical protein
MKSSLKVKCIPRRGQQTGNKDESPQATARTHRHLIPASARRPSHRKLSSAITISSGTWRRHSQELAARQMDPIRVPQLLSIEAARARDVERFLAHYADGICVVLFDGTPMFADKQVMREQYGKLFADSPDVTVSIASRMAAGAFVVDQEEIAGFHFGDMPAEMTALTVYQVTDGKISKLMLLF